MASGLAETAKLVSSLELKDNFTPVANKAIKSLGRLESTGFRVGQQIGKGFNNAARNLKRIAEVGVVALTGAIALGVRSLGDLARTQNQTAAVIKSTGGAAKVSAEQVRANAEALENLSTVDDKVIQDGENMLLTFTNIGNKVFPQATKAALDMAVAMAGGNVEQVDLKASAIQLGKALNDPIKGITALQKVGVTFTAKQKKRIEGFVKEGKVVEAQKVILAELNKEFGKASEAAGTGPEAVMRRLKDAGEDLSQVLARGVLPVLERFGKFLTAKLADPVFLAQVDEFGRKLGEAGGKFLDFIEKVDFKAIGTALSTAAGFAGQIIDAFLKAPLWLQEAIVTGWGLNKLTGGAVTGIFGELASGLIKGVLGMNAGVVNINAGTVVGGGGAGIPGAGAAAGGGLLATLGAVALPVTIAAISTSAATQLANADLGGKGIPGKFDTPGSGILPFGIEASFNNLKTAINILTRRLPTSSLPGSLDRPGTVGPAADKNREATERVQTAVETMKGKIAGELAGNKTAIDGAASAASLAGNTVRGAVGSSASSIVGAIYANRPNIQTDVRVYVTAAGVTKSTTEQTRYGPGNGSAGGGDGGGGAFGGH